MPVGKNIPEETKAKIRRLHAEERLPVAAIKERLGLGLKTIYAALEGHPRLCTKCGEPGIPGKDFRQRGVHDATGKIWYASACYKCTRAAEERAKIALAERKAAEAQSQADRPPQPKYSVMEPSYGG